MLDDRGSERACPHGWGLGPPWGPWSSWGPMGALLYHPGPWRPLSFANPSLRASQPSCSEQMQPQRMGPDPTHTALSSGHEQHPGQRLPAGKGTVSSAWTCGVNRPKL